MESCYEQAKAILRAHRELLDEVALYLLQKETITGDELMTYVNAEGKRLQAPEQPEDRAASTPPDAPDMRTLRQTTRSRWEFCGRRAHAGRVIPFPVPVRAADFCCADFSGLSILFPVFAPQKIRRRRKFCPIFFF